MITTGEAMLELFAGISPKYTAEMHQNRAERKAKRDRIQRLQNFLVEVFEQNRETLVRVDLVTPRYGVDSRGDYDTEGRILHIMGLADKSVSIHPPYGTPYTTLRRTTTGLLLQVPEQGDSDQYLDDRFRRAVLCDGGKMIFSNVHDESGIFTAEYETGMSAKDIINKKT